jgi:hypothetical protein
VKRRRQRRGQGRVGEGATRDVVVATIVTRMDSGGSSLETTFTGLEALSLAEQSRSRRVLSSRGFTQTRVARRGGGERERERGTVENRESCAMNGIILVLLRLHQGRYLGVA